MERLLEVLEDIRDDVDFASADDLVDGKVLNSFEVLQIVSELNEEFDVVIPAAEVIAENFNSAQKMYDMLVRLKGGPLE